MKTDDASVSIVAHRPKSNGWILGGTAMLAFAAGSLGTAWFMHIQEARADSSRVFELMVYHALPGKATALESVFRDVSKLQTKHDIHAIGYWVPQKNSPWKDTFVYLVAHPSLEEGNKNWDALHSDTEFLPYRRAAAPLIEKVNGEYNVDEIYMRPTDYSPMQ